MQQKKQDEGQKERRNKGNVPAQEPLGERIEEEVEHIVDEAQEEVAVARKLWYQTRNWGFILLTIDTILLALFALCIILFRGKHWWRTALLIISALFFVLVGPSRIYLGDHWASDVLGAYLIGGIWLAMSLWLYLYLRGRGVLAPRGKRARHFHRKYVR